MQIFVLDSNPHVSAVRLRNMDPRRFNKQILELAQLIAVAFPEWGLLRMDGKPYSTRNHKNHPCVQWVKDNPDWSVDYMRAMLFLCPTHGCASVLQQLPTFLRHPPNVQHHYFSKVPVPGSNVYEMYYNLLQRKAD